MMVDKKQRLADEAAAAAMARSGLGGQQKIDTEKVPEVIVWGDLLDLMIDHMSPSSLQADIKYLRCDTKYHHSISIINVNKHFF